MSQLEVLAPRLQLGVTGPSRRYLERARDLFQQQGIDVIAGVPEGDPNVLVDQYLNGTLVTGENTCDHD